MHWRYLWQLKLEYGVSFLCFDDVFVILGLFSNRGIAYSDKIEDIDPLFRRKKYEEIKRNKEILTVPGMKKESLTLSSCQKLSISLISIGIYAFVLMLCTITQVLTYLPICLTNGLVSHAMPHTLPESHQQSCSKRHHYLVTLQVCHREGARVILQMVCLSNWWDAG